MTDASLRQPTLDEVFLRLTGTAPAATQAAPATPTAPATPATPATHKEHAA